ncbi:winged helix-turn-helix transcriptional regulator [Peribacillus simplex]|uniref:winged helix-turn-helix transcriptional regulator n=1 Tax=Peribacillus simplex TaxID=1478 RepID=UPI003D9B0D31
MNHAISGITKQVLTNQLHEMENDEEKVEYEVTCFGLSLEPSLLRLAQLGKPFVETLTNNES